MRFDQEFIAEVIRSTNLVTLIDRHIPLKKASAKEMEACCPFHEEKTPSFKVPINRSNEDSFYHCFGCNAHGGAIDFVMGIKGVGFIEAVKYICSEFNIPLPEPKSNRPERSEQEKRISSQAFALGNQLWNALPDSGNPNLDSRIASNTDGLLVIADKFKGLKDHLFKSGSMRGLREDKNTPSIFIPLRLRNGGIVGFQRVTNEGHVYTLPIHPNYKPIDLFSSPSKIEGSKKHYVALTLNPLLNFTERGNIHLLPSFNGEITEQQYKGMMYLDGDVTVVLPFNEDIKGHFKLISSLIDHYEPGNLIKVISKDNQMQAQYLFDHLASSWPSLPNNVKDYFFEKLQKKELATVTDFLAEPNQAPQPTRGLN